MTMIIELNEGEVCTLLIWFMEGDAESPACIVQIQYSSYYKLQWNYIKGRELGFFQGLCRKSRFINNLVQPLGFVCVHSM